MRAGAMLCVLLGLLVGRTGQARPGERAAIPKVAATSTGAARADRSSTRRALPPVQKLTFGEGDVIESERDMGAGDVIRGEQKLRHSSLIPVRSDFLAELIKSAEEI